MVSVLYPFIEYSRSCSTWRPSARLEQLNLELISNPDSTLGGRPMTIIACRLSVPHITFHKLGRDDSHCILHSSLFSILDSTPMIYHLVLIQIELRRECT